jgi:hypothetical protein
MFQCFVWTGGTLRHETADGSRLGGQSLRIYAVLRLQNRDGRLQVRFKPSVLCGWGLRLQAVIGFCVHDVWQMLLVFSHLGWFVFSLPFRTFDYERKTGADFLVRSFYEGKNSLLMNDVSHVFFLLLFLVLKRALSLSLSFPHRFWKQGYWRSHLQHRKYHISALYVVDLKKFRRIAAGDRLRGQYQGLSQDPNSLSNLDQVRPPRT